MKLTYETVNGTNTIEVKTARKLIMSLVDVPYINILLNEDIRVSIEWLLEDLPKLKSKGANMGVYKTCNGKKLVRVNYSDNVVTVNVLSDFMAKRAINEDIEIHQQIAQGV